MLKVLTFLALTFYVSPVQTYAQPDKTQKATKSTEPPPSTSPIPEQSRSQSIQPEPEKNVKADVRIISTPGKDDHDRAAFWLNVALVIAGFAGIGVGIATLTKIERQTSATEKQVCHLITSERAWLVISALNGKEECSLGMLWEPRFYWSVKNVGNTPAKLIETQSICRVSDEGMIQLPLKPVFPKPVPLNERILAPGDSIQFHTFWENKEGKAFTEDIRTLDALFLTAYGYVKYFTVLSPESCESGFCDDFMFVPEGGLSAYPFAKPIVFHPFLGAPSAYTKHT